MDTIKTDELEAIIRGKAVKPGDPGYDDARRIWNARFDRRPGVIIRCGCTADVAATVRFAREHDLALAVKGGGHAFAAHTVGDGGLLIDLSPMKDIEVDAGTKTARVGPGVTWGELDHATQQHGLATVGGTVSSVGVAGFTLGGGSGYLSRKYGMAVDNLLSAEVVTADGGLVHASAEEHADLFWALRGGGGNFGIVTSFEFRLHEVGPQVLAGQIVHPFQDAAAVLRRYRDFMNTAPDEVQCYAFLLRVPPVEGFPKAFHGELAIDLVVFHADAEGGDDLAPLLAFGKPILAAVGPQPYTAAQQAFDAGLPKGQRYESRAHYLAGLPDTAIETFLSAVGALPGTFTVAYFGAEGGAISRIPGDATAFPHRDAAYSIHVMAGWSEPEQDAAVTAWTRQLHEAMSPHATGGVYVNLLGTDEGWRIPSAYGENFGRLLRLKSQWDPDNLFRHNHNLRPHI